MNNEIGHHCCLMYASIVLFLSLAFLSMRLSRAIRSSEIACNLHSEVDRRDHCHIASPLSVSSTEYISEIRLLSQRFARARAELLCGKLRDGDGSDGATTVISRFHFRN